MSRLFSWLMMIVLLMFGVGCTTKLSNHGEMGFRYGTEFTFFHRASKTSDELATSETRLPSLEEWLMREAGPPEPEAEPE